MVSRRRGPRGAWALAAVFSVTFAACLFGPENAVGPCAGTECDDGNPCTDDICAQDGFCDHVPSSTLPDDGNDCTDDSCDGTTAVHVKKDGSPCGTNDMLVCKTGECKCENDGQCGASNACVTHTCDRGTCLADYAPARTLVDTAGEGDCLQNVCDGKGAVVPAPDENDAPEDSTKGDCKKPACGTDGQIVEVTDDADIPGDIDGNPCTAESCVDGTPTSDPAPLEGMACGMPKCDGAGDGFEATPAPICQSGVCTSPPAVPCGLYECNSEKTACRTSCFSQQHCASSAYCAVGNNCVPKLPNGQACQPASDVVCQSGICNFEGVCCNAECYILCRSCRGDYNGGKAGSCEPISNNTDPYSECSGICGGGGGNGCCDGTGDCH